MARPIAELGGAAPKGAAEFRAPSRIQGMPAGVIEGPRITGKPNTPVLRSPEGLPLAAIVPLPFERREFKLNSDVANTFGHELCHTIKALHEGIPVLKMSTKAEGISKGRTIFAGVYDEKKFVRVAVAGAVNPGIGSASGYGHDFQQARRALYDIGENPNQSLFPHILEAEGVINSLCPPPVRARASEIGAYLHSIGITELSVGMVKNIIAHAAKELYLESTGRMQELEALTLEVEADQKLPEEHFVMEILPDSQRRIIEYSHDHIVKENDPYCSLCMGKNNAHFESCPILIAQRKNSPKADFDIQSPSDIGTIEPTTDKNKKENIVIYEYPHSPHFSTN